MAQISKETRIGELLVTFPGSSSDSDGNWNALPWMPGISDGISGRSSNGSWNRQ